MVDKHLLVWLGRLNGNLNQIAKYINVKNKAESQIDIVKVLAELALIRSSLDSILEIQYVDKNLQK
ncbi:TPA: plasmid mobilization relaxosome protein MobC [Pasteurella multocida]|nr:plasmid mobilization relaxosome protein MobC [Pasteurella multocida]HDR1168253.1 plasmid mobilization relaxosome protein MobC [Pasteurella multocida]HDR1174520.1 plasmid mobilization relaxosome protein MobC [Pasteurella multocida]